MNWVFYMGSVGESGVARSDTGHGWGIAPSLCQRAQGSWLAVRCGQGLGTCDFSAIASGP